MLFFLLITYTLSQSNPDCGNAYCTACYTNKKCYECLEGYMVKNGTCEYLGDHHCAETVRNEQTGEDICIKCENTHRLNFKTGKCLLGKERCKE